MYMHSTPVCAIQKGQKECMILEFCNNNIKNNTVNDKSPKAPVARWTRSRERSIVPGARWNLLPPGTQTRRAYTAT